MLTSVGLLFHSGYLDYHRILTAFPVACRGIDNGKLVGVLADDVWFERNQQFCRYARSELGWV